MEGGSRLAQGWGWRGRRSGAGDLRLARAAGAPSRAGGGLVGYKCSAPPCSSPAPRWRTPGTGGAPILLVQGAAISSSGAA